MNNKIFLSIFSFFLLNGIVLDSFGQSPGKADKRFESYEFSKAIPVYEKFLEHDSTNKEALENLGNCYRLTNQVDKAEQCYAKVVVIPGTESIYKFYYAQALLTNEKCAEAEKWFDAYHKEVPGDKRGEEFLAAVKDREKSSDDDRTFIAQAININSSDGDFGAAVYKEGIVFSSSRLKDAWSDRKDYWTGVRYTSLYFAKGKATGFSEPELFASSVQTKYNNGPVCFNKNGDEMYFTRNNIEEGKVHANKESIVKIKIFSSLYQNGHWSDPVSFAYNNDKYSCGHPALSADGTKFYFSSDMPGTLGGMDLWVCTKEGSSWSKPQNLGPMINTQGNEVFPTVTDDGTLYFSSNGLPGKGGLDIFSTTLSNGKYAVQQRLHAPFNSPDDDFSFVMDLKTQSGYFSSNRVHQGMNDNIFSFCKNVISVVTLVVDKKTNEPLVESTVKIVQDGNVVEEKRTDKTGRVVMSVIPDKKYKIIADHESYESDSLDLSDANYTTVKDSALIVLALAKTNVLISIEGQAMNDATGKPSPEANLVFINLMNNDTVLKKTDAEGRFSFTNLLPATRYRIIAGTDYCESKVLDTNTTGITKTAAMKININLFCLSDKFVMKNIYYDLDKYNIRPDAATELDKLVDLLKRYPAIKIELSSHTDCRNTNDYNMKLSQNRADAVVTYLVQHGIKNNRLHGTGYGESKPVNKCECEGKHVVPCTEEQHQMNRRTEVKITSGNWN